MYAIVDIETTGSHAHNNGITEIAIVLHDGKQVEGRFSTLINPQVPIPKYVVGLTGITNAMVAGAPLFKEVAPNIFNLLQGRIFVAHNVNFDASFIKHHLRVNGFEWNPKKLCTLRMSRKVFPNLPKYGLEHICRSLDIHINDRHRATGDADATATLFQMILNVSDEKQLKDFLRKEAKEQIFPPNLPNEQIKELPKTPGVYYFHNAKGKVIYVGKAKVLKKRVVSHFTGLDTGKKRQAFLKEIHSLSFKECPTELAAFILESVEIKRLWPEYNYSQKRVDRLYGIYMFEDANGYLRLAIDKKRKHLLPVKSFGLMLDAHRTLRKMIQEFSLDAYLCFISKVQSESVLPAAQYNKRVHEALEWLNNQAESFAIFEPSVLNDHEHSCILMENGRFYGMGIVPLKTDFTDIDILKKHVTQLPENEVVHSMIRTYAVRYPGRVFSFGA
ncbi:MAG: GIY-YIG nuclease family protein [Filimonas sp.]|nr:GIY-YIG nuclease family protein [Filimonas sp.]